MMLHMDAKDRICGASTENYLLEKVRVTQLAENERNFHIFYQARGP